MVTSPDLDQKGDCLKNQNETEKRFTCRRYQQWGYFITLKTKRNTQKGCPPYPQSVEERQSCDLISANLKCYLPTWN